jgi:Sel1 repeat
LILAIVVVAGSVATGSGSAQTRPTPDVAAASIENQRGIEALNRKDYASALSWFQKGADHGSPIAQFNMGWMYRDGLGVKQDYAQALVWFQKAAAQGNAPAQDYIGKMYHDGMGVKQDYAAAMAWSLKAAAQGNVAARMRIAVMYMNGEGVQKDLPTAMAWMQKTPEEPAKLQVASTDKPDITLSCDLQTNSGKNEPAIITVDTSSKQVKIESNIQGTMEFKDGFFGKIITGGFLAKDAIDLHQFVTINDDYIKFGFTKDGELDVNSIDRRTGVMKSEGRVTQCIPLKRKF